MLPLSGKPSRLFCILFWETDYLFNTCLIHLLIKSFHVFDVIYLRLMSFDVFQTLMDGKGDKATAQGMELLRTEVGKLKEELKTSGDGWYPFTYATHHPP